MNPTRRLQLFVGLVSVLALLAGAFPTFAVTVEEIPSPRPNGWSVDLTGTIPAETLRQMDRLGEEVKAANGGEIAVVVIGSTDGVPSHDFAVRLANHWGIGDRQKNNGVLLLAALSDRSADIVLGEGIDTTVNNRLSEEIMQGEMVPRFRAGNPGGALLEGARACARRILNVEPLPAETATPLNPLVSAETSAPPQAEEAAPQPVPVSSTPPEPSVASLVGCFLTLVLGAFGLIYGVYLLLRAPRCKQCRVPMKVLSEQEDDAYLGPGERTEERIGSVDHKILMCPQCGASRKKSAARLLSSYSRCSGCGTRAEESSSYVIESPTYSSSGLRRVDTRCLHCGHQSTYTTAIPRLEQPRPATSSRSSLWSSSSRSSSSSSSSSSRSSSSSSSSSSRSSGFGGGRSSGGGASGKW